MTIKSIETIGGNEALTKHHAKLHARRSGGFDFGAVRDCAGE